MKHYIIAKFKEGTDVKALAGPVKEIFERALEIPGIHGIDVRPSCSDRSNRYDLMILVTMDKEALPAYDASEPHHCWKEKYGDMIEKKAIFDCEE
ncbi:MAG: Dabb family protein [Stomatobaculum sp.]|nr:Dabb family protein [Stomatobaculum sp.]